MFSRKILDNILDLVYPSSLYCICCGKIIDDTRPYRLCNECMTRIRWASGRTCLKCGKPLSDHDPNDICFSCREHRHVFDQGYTCCEYGMDARSIIFALKYGGRTDIGVTVAEIMHDRLDQIRREEGFIYDAITMVPMYPKKERIRGYNQADVIASTLAKLEDVDYLPHAMVRTRATAAMRSLTPLERRQNIAGAIEVDDAEAIAGKDLLVVDDIYTTGSTADAIAEILKAGGADRIYFLTFAAGADVLKTE